MDRKITDPLDTGKRIRRERRKRHIRKWMRRVLRNRRMLLAVIWMVKTIVQLLRLIG